MSKNITIQEAIKRIDEFAIHHAIKDLPNSAYTVESFDMAIEALQMRIPKPVDIYIDLLNNMDINTFCPRCHIGIPATRFTQCCDSCGQRLDWDNTNVYINGESYNNETT